MSRLAHYGPGEIADRLSILALKILFGSDTGKDVRPWRQERETLKGINVDVDLVTVLDLAVVNAALWHAEDDLRALRQGGSAGTSPYARTEYHEAVTKVAFWIQALNDRRARLVEALNSGLRMGDL